MPSVISHVAPGVPLNSLLDYAKEHSADLVVLGGHSHGAISSLLAGNLAGSMARRAEVPTLIVPAQVG